MPKKCKPPATINVQIMAFPENIHPAGQLEGKLYVGDESEGKTAHLRLWQVGFLGVGKIIDFKKVRLWGYFAN
jgi:hypothetical protein